MVKAGYGLVVASLLPSFIVVDQSDCVSEAHDNRYGGPLECCLWPVLLSLHMLPLGVIIRGHNLCLHGYADNPTLYFCRRK